MAGFFDLNDPVSLYQLQGALQGLQGVSGPSRLPMGFGNTIGAMAGGMLGGRIKGQQEAAQDEFFKSLMQPQQGGQQAPMGMPSAPGSPGQYGTRLQTVQQQGAGNIGSGQAADNPALMNVQNPNSIFGGTRPMATPETSVNAMLPSGLTPGVMAGTGTPAVSAAQLSMMGRAGMGKEALALLTQQQSQSATQNVEMMKAHDARNLKLLELGGYDTSNPITGQDGKVYLVNKFGQTMDTGYTKPEDYFAAVKTGTGKYAQFGNRGGVKESKVPVEVDPNQPFMHDPNDPSGKIVPNQPYQDYRFKLAEANRQPTGIYPYQNAGPIADANGNPLGQGYFDRAGGKLLYDDPANPGQKIPAPPGARAIPPGTGGPLTPQQFLKGKNDLEVDRQGLDRLQQYFNSVKGTDVGMQRWSEKVSAQAKTLFGSGKLTPEELNLQISKNQLQGLLGLFRTDVVGPGVMTEIDAQRVLQALGGDVTALQNPQAVEAALRQMYRYKYDRMKVNYNEVARSAPFFREKLDPLTMPDALQTGQPGQAAAATPGAVQPPRLDAAILTPENIRAAAQKAGVTEEQMRAKLRSNGVQVP